MSSIRGRAPFFCLLTCALAFLTPGCGSDPAEGTGASAKKQQLEELQKKAMEKKAAIKK